MNSLVSLLVLTCACARAEPLAAALQRRSDAQGVYAQQFVRYQRQPSAGYAALSLHAPFPVLHVLSRLPLQPLQSLQSLQSLHAADQAAAYSSLRPTYAHPYPYAAPSTTRFTYDINSELDEPTILYARPDPRGGYSYRRRPARRRAPAPAPARPAEPLVIRVHKYRVVRDR